MANRSDMRASDADRERVTEILRDAHGEGRLSQDELLERIDGVYGARTYRELDRLIDDVPLARRARPRPVPARLEAGAARRPVTAQRVARMFLAVNWWVYGLAVALSLMIWALVLVSTDEGVQYFWPLWVAGPWGLVVGAAELAYRRRWPK